MVQKFEYKRATMEDIDELVRTRIIVLRAANKLSDDEDMSVVEEESKAYYRRALETGEHIAYLVYDNGAFVGAGGVSFYQVMPTYHNPTGKKAYIMNMYTAPEYRRQGIAFHTLDWPVFFIIDRRYTYGFQDLLFHRLEKVESLEVTLGLQFPESKDIVGLDEKEFKQLLGAIQDGLVGNEKFKRRFEEELRKYRVFNKLGYQPIFSVLICGNSGIGKTEVARILTRTLSPDQPFIKINFGNYSDHNALSSLIGSPRGYIGSSKGELSEKLTNSRSKVILIDEFEKCDKQVQNFFLQLLEDGVFTDSLGRDYNLDKYIIVFTANLPSDKITTKISPELLSRFNLKYSFSLLSDKEKETYIENRTALMLKDVQEELNINVSPEKISEIKDIDIKKYSNMRDINAELMKRISDVIYPELFSNGG